ncbi:hypothetical protein GCM10028799_80670 [Kribbella italica]
MVVVSSCSQPAAAPAEESKDASPQLERFYNQDLSFGSCADYAPNVDDDKIFVDPAECARLTVPLDYDKPDGKTAQVAVLRVPASGGRDERIGSLVVNPGGPGGPGMAQAAITSILLKKSPVVDRFDIVGFDPRGVGRATAPGSARSTPRCSPTRSAPWSSTELPILARTVPPVGSASRKRPSAPSN